MNSRLEQVLRTQFAIPAGARLGWHFCNAAATLGYGDGRPIRVGETLSVEGTPVICELGLHASPTIDAAWNNAQAKERLALVWVAGDIDAGGSSKFCGLQRHTLELLSVEQTDLLYAEYAQQRDALYDEYLQQNSTLYIEYVKQFDVLYADYKLQGDEALADYKRKTKALTAEYLQKRSMLIAEYKRQSSALGERLEVDVIRALAAHDPRFTHVLKLLNEAAFPSSNQEEAQ